MVKEKQHLTKALPLQADVQIESCRQPLKDVILMLLLRLYVFSFCSMKRILPTLSTDLFWVLRPLSKHPQSARLLRNARPRHLADAPSTNGKHAFAKNGVSILLLSRTPFYEKRSVTGGGEKRWRWGPAFCWQNIVVALREEGHSEVFIAFCGKFQPLHPSRDTKTQLQQGTPPHAHPLRALWRASPSGAHARIKA